MLDLLNEKIEVYEATLGIIEATEETLKENSIYIGLQELKKESANLESEIKDIIKKNDILEAKGHKKLFTLQNRISKSRIYDIEKIKANERLSNQVLITTVDSSVFEVLEKAEKIDNSEQYYSVNEKVIKAVIMNDLKEI